MSTSQDLLCDNVPKTIRELRSAGIMTWIASGDSLETTIHTGMKASMISDGAEIIRFKTTDWQELNE